LVDLEGFEPSTSSMPLRRAPNCATGPRYAIVLLRSLDLPDVIGTRSSRLTGARQAHDMRLLAAESRPSRCYRDTLLTADGGATGPQGRRSGAPAGFNIPSRPKGPQPGRATLQRRPAHVPVSGLLVSVRHTQHQSVVKGFAHKLQADGQTAGAKPGRQ
jgi:hypothetical protein